LPKILTEVLVNLTGNLKRKSCPTTTAFLTGIKSTINKKKNTTQGIKGSRKSREERKQKKVGEKRDKVSQAKNYHLVYLQS